MADDPQKAERVPLVDVAGGPGGERCGGCYYWERRPNDPGVGDCKRFPPALLPQMVQELAAETETPPAAVEAGGYVSPWGHPCREADDWCGEFRPRAGES